MTIKLRPEHEQAIADAMRTGAYQNPDDVIGRALEMLHSEDESLKNKKDSSAAKIDRVFEHFDHGKFLSAEESRADMEKRKGAWHAQQRRG